MRILQTHFHRSWGGEAASILTLSRYLRQRGHSVMVAAPANSELYERAAAEKLLVFSRLRFRPGLGWGRLADLLAMRRLIRSHRFDVVHSHGSLDGWTAALAVRGLRPRPLVVRTRHNLKPIRNHAFNRWYFGPLVDHIIAISASVRDSVVGTGMVSAERVTVIPSPPDLAPFLAGGDGRAFRAEMSLPPDAAVIATVARLSPEKGIDVLVRAFGQLAPRYPRARLVICGSGRKVKLELIELFKELGIEDRVCRCGFRQDIPNVLAATDIYALPSRAEGLGFSLLEAMASGCPVVASRVGGVPEIVTDGEDGLLVEPENPSALAEAIARLLDDPALRARLGAAGRKTAQERFSTEHLVARVEALYETLLARRRPSAPRA